MNDLTTFTNPEFGQVRTVEIDGTPWLVGKDVAVALGYKNPGKAIIAHVDEEDKRLEMLPQETDSQNGNASPASKTALINESGLYSLILSSKMPKAKAFKRWVTSEVLPAIRKTGAYESFQAQQHIEQLEATNTRLNAAIQAVGTAKQQLADVISLRNDFIEHRDNYKARYMQAKTDYSRICDSLRQAEGLVAKAQADLDSRIDQLSIIAFGLPGFDEIMNAVIGTVLPAERRRNKMLNASTIRGTFRQIPYWKLRGRFHSCGFRDQGIANAIGIGTDTMSKRMNGKQPWTSTEIAEICKTLDIPQDEIGELFFPTVEKGESA